MMTLLIFTSEKRGHSKLQRRQTRKDIIIFQKFKRMEESTNALSGAQIFDPLQIGNQREMSDQAMLTKIQELITEIKLFKRQFNIFKDCVIEQLPNVRQKIKKKQERAQEKHSMMSLQSIESKINKGRYDQFSNQFLEEQVQQKRQQESEVQPSVSLQDFLSKSDAPIKLIQLEVKQQESQKMLSVNDVQIQRSPKKKPIKKQKKQ